ncbi:hypothetical protein Bca52824_018402 [Brassica carinata]|uniref:Uncharacterized protein n=1 Tax=Brassica carinata TaxID=52824 RepID=A0A8X8AXE5_BRACI|nr:hypothetical protein Bca52824_018402 [Brassica carinata]
MAKNRADAPVETPPRMSEVVGEIDTRSPFQSVRDAVSLFRQASFSKQQQQPRLSSPSSSQDATDVSEKETQLLLAEQEMDRVQLCLDTSVKAKARALSDLDSAQRKAFDLRAKLEATKHSKKSAILTKHTMNQRLEKLQSRSQETERARENYILATAGLLMARQKLAEIKQEFSISVEERLSELHRAEEAECATVVNSQKIRDMTHEISEMRDAAERLKSEAELRLEDLRRGCDPELRKDIDELEEISAENELLQEEIKLARELKEAKSAMREIFDEERSYKSLVGSHGGVGREAERTRQEAEEMRMQVDELRREAAGRRTVMGEAVKQLEIVGRAVESLTHDEPDKKIRISLKEYEELRGKHEESERMVQYKAKTVAVQLEEIKESRVEGEIMLEEKMKEMEEVEEAIDSALRNAEIAEEAHCIVDAELRKWKPQEL